MSDLPPYGYGAGYGTAVPVTPPRPPQAQQPWPDPMRATGGQPQQHSQYLAQALQSLGNQPVISNATSLGTHLLAKALTQNTADQQANTQATQQAGYLQSTDPQLSGDLQGLGISGVRPTLFQRAGNALGGLFNLGSSGLGGS